VGNVFSVDLANGEHVQQVSALDNHPGPGIVTLKYRELDQNALPLPEEGSEWRVLTVREVKGMLVAGDRRAAWLRDHTTVDLACEVLSDPKALDALAYLPRRGTIPSWHHPHPVSGPEDSAKGRTSRPQLFVVIEGVLASAPYGEDASNGAEAFFDKIEQLAPILLALYSEQEYEVIAEVRRGWIGKQLCGNVLLIPVCGANVIPLLIQAPGDVLICATDADADAWELAGGKAIIHSEYEHTLDALLDYLFAQAQGAPVREMGAQV
jgi:hypothetical protein